MKGGKLKEDGEEEVGKPKEMGNVIRYLYLRSQQAAHNCHSGFKSVL